MVHGRHLLGGGPGDRCREGDDLLAGPPEQTPCDPLHRRGVRAVLGSRGQLLEPGEEVRLEPLGGADALCQGGCLLPRLPAPHDRLVLRVEHGDPVVAQPHHAADRGRQQADEHGHEDDPVDPGPPRQGGQVRGEHHEHRQQHAERERRGRRRAGRGSTPRASSRGSTPRHRRRPPASRAASRPLRATPPTASSSSVSTGRTRRRASASRTGAPASWKASSPAGPRRASASATAASTKHAARTTSVRPGRLLPSRTCPA